MPRRLHPLDYTVGWICALDNELGAGTQLLDEIHESLANNPNDENMYTLGCMSGHNVVIVCLPAGRPGTNAAAIVASHMKSTFTSIRFGFMVGIGGGVPSSKFDIRLGDVVVSEPQLTHPGVVQYDFGKTELGGFLRTGALRPPPELLLGAVAKMKASYKRRQCSLLPHLSAFDSLPAFTRVGAGPDILFEPTYDHVGGDTCKNCEPQRIVQRTERTSQEVVVHYGTIASGNRVIKDGNARDQMSKELGGVLCFEMEAAGLMNSFPCLVIRGICDYADSHKNKDWQPYAAATAAAYAKELLALIPAAEVNNQRTVVEATETATALAKWERNDVLEMLEGMARTKKVKLKWRESVVDLLKLLDLPSDATARVKLAESLQIHVGKPGTPERNNALRRAVLEELAANQGSITSKMSNCYD